ncbi:UTP--glucose-1-phosphate uridylyltransferase [Spirochaeta africana]|uniref:UDP-glucose pyrophosphorylase n=1 Tax=Spirochaeta africana (strain ATCC 700263 / DSM 8902 / Z-7692) TaxID=889378 RepID=H9UIK9_SPIAZ|nr:UTP--glucose-1-phosphate uridylyltransferase [Spirochaeta africana]AFG37352.1 UDP-glucose pyrophosphorylase [Spirochaeta africana DSM 8902]
MSEVSEELRQELESRGVDVAMTLSLLQRLNNGDFDHLEPVRMDSLPDIDGQDVIDATGDLTLTVSRQRLTQLLEDWQLPVSVAELEQISRISAAPRSAEIQLNTAALRALGIALSPLVAYGVLNGGSATSYCDTKKNRGLDSGVFAAVKAEFETAAQLATDRPKGLAPAFIHPDGTPGPSFLELKMRSLLLTAYEYQLRFSDIPDAASAKQAAAPMFQMSSVFTHDDLLQAYDGFRESPLLQDLIAATGIDITRVEDAVQPLLAAFTHSSEGTPRRIFDQAYGTPNTPVALPGGHGQNFQVLADIYRTLFANGKRFAYIGNVDNLGFTVEPASLAYFALSDRPAAFEFAFKTPVDVKGGVLVREADGRLTCGDIGPAVSEQDLQEAESRGTPILFNAATGLLRLDYLVEHLDEIISKLPVRLSDQDKDAGRYSQAEQVTWEVIGMLDRPLILGISKYRRFLAAKLLLETLITSGRAPQSGFSPENKQLQAEALRLHSGLDQLLQEIYGMACEDNRYRPLSPDELRRKWGLAEPR